VSKPLLDAGYWAGHTSFSVVLDCYGHLYEGHEADVLARLDAFASESSAPDHDAPSRWIPRVFRGARATDDTEMIGPRVPDQDLPVGDTGLEPMTSAV
jgi:hypothetical protein